MFPRGNAEDPYSELFRKVRGENPSGSTNNETDTERLQYFRGCAVNAVMEFITQNDPVCDALTKAYTVAQLSEVITDLADEICEYVMKGKSSSDAIDPMVR